MNKEVCIKQAHPEDSAAASIASVAAYFGLKISLAQIRALYQAQSQDSSIQGITQILEKIGLQCKVIKGEVNCLDSLPLPAIVNSSSTEAIAQYAVLYRVKRNRITVMDPQTGKATVHTVESFAERWSSLLILIERISNCKQSNPNKTLYRRFWNLVQPHRYIVAKALLGALIYTILGLSASIYIEKIADEVLLKGDLNLLYLLSLGMLILVLFQIFIGVVKSIWVLQTGQKIDRYLITTYYRHLLKLPQQFFDSIKVGEIISRINDAAKIRTFVNDLAIQTFVNFFIIVFSFVLMFVYHWKLALLMALIIPCYAIIYAIANKWNQAVERRLIEERTLMESHLIEALSCVRTIKQFGLEESVNAKTDLVFTKLLRTVYTSTLNSIFAQNATELLSKFFTLLLLFTGSIYVVKNKISPGELLSFYALIGYFTNPVSQLITINKVLQNALIAADRLFAIMDLEQEAFANSIELTTENLGHIEFKRVTFSYGHARVFTDFDCVIPRGKTTAVVGESGSGKTTLIALLQRLYTPEAGAIFIGTNNINQLSGESMKKLIATVPQQINLFSGNVVENIALGEPFPELARILEIAKKIDLLNFIEKLPNGLFTQLGENGVLLSGGQKQRIAIARALYKNPEILILDEATASLDSNSELLIHNTLKQIRRQRKTTIIIAHRLSSVVLSDTILVMENGKIVERGNHQELLSYESRYKSMWKKQTATI